MAEGFSGKIVFDINVNVSGGGSGGGGGGGGPVTPGGGGPARPEGTSPRGGGNKAAKAAQGPEVMYGLAGYRKQWEREERDDNKFQSYLEDQQKREGNRRASIAKRQATQASRAASTAESQSRIAAMLDPDVRAARGSDIGGLQREIREKRAARSINNEVLRDKQLVAADEAKNVASKLGPVEAAFDRMAGQLQNLFGVQGDAGQRAAAQGGKISALGKGFIFGGISRNLASGVPGFMDPAASGTAAGVGALKGGVAAGLQIGGFAAGAAIKAIGGLPGFMIGTALGPVADQVIDAVAGPDVRRSQDTKSFIEGELSATRRAGLTMSPERLTRVARLGAMAAGMTEDDRQIAAKAGVAAELASGNAGIGTRLSAVWHDPLGSLGAGLAMPFMGREAADKWVSDRIMRDAIDRVRPATRDAAFESASGY